MRKPENFSRVTQENQEYLRGAQLTNLSGQPTQILFHWFPDDLRAESIVALPDISPGRSPLPTGTCVEIDMQKQPEWRRFAVSDVGCGMQVLKSKINWEEFDSRKTDWDTVGKTLKQNAGKLGDLGSGNHFLDAAVDDDSTLYFIIHTGSRDESKTVEPLVNQPDAFDEAFAKVVDWARNNRTEISNVLQTHYGPLETILDAPHNFYKIQDNTVTIYKGAAQVLPNQRHIIPSNLDSQMALVQSTGMSSQIHHALSHGTGRAMTRSESKDHAGSYDFEYLRKKVYIPDYISNASLRSELPVGYRPLEHTLSHLAPYIQVEKLLTPIAYLGQL